MPILNFMNNKIYIILNIVLSLLIVFFYLFENLNFNLWGDVETYISIAKDMKHPFDTDVREPLWIWLIKILTLFDNILIYRLSTVFIHIFIIYFTYKIMCNLSSNNNSIFISLSILSLNPYIAFLSIQAMRDSGILILIIFLTYAIIVIKENETLKKQNIIIFLIVFSLLGLIKIQYLFTTFLITLYFFLVLKIINIKTAFFFLVVPLAFSTPHLINNYYIYDDIFYSLNIHLKWMRNFEMQYLVNGDSSNMYGGDNISSMEYIFLNRNIIDLAIEIITGFIFLFVIKPFHIFMSVLNLLPLNHLVISLKVNYIFFLSFYIIPILIGFFSTFYNKKLFLITLLPFFLMNFSVILAEYLDPRIYNYSYLYLGLWHLLGINITLFHIKNFIDRYQLS